MSFSIKCNLHPVSEHVRRCARSAISLYLQILRRAQSSVSLARTSLIRGKKSHLKILLEMARRSHFQRREGGGSLEREHARAMRKKSESPIKTARMGGERAQLINASAADAANGAEGPRGGNGETPRARASRIEIRVGCTRA